MTEVAEPAGQQFSLGSGPAGPFAPIGGWRTATVREVDHPGPRAVRLRLAVPDRVDHFPGQHYVIRLTAPDGYTASRSYSIASAPSDGLLEFYVERLPEGEVSVFLADVVEPGDQLEIRGPIGGYFVWTGDRSVLAVGGGSGVVPFVSMLRHAVDLGRPELFRAVVAARTMADLPYAAEFIRAGARITLSREDLGGRAAGRLAGTDLDGWDRPGPGGASPGQSQPRRFLVCGSAGFAESASRLLVDRGAEPASIRVERFGPSGG